MRIHRIPHTTGQPAQRLISWLSSENMAAKCSITGRTENTKMIVKSGHCPHMHYHCGHWMVNTETNQMIINREHGHSIFQASTTEQGSCTETARWLAKLDVATTYVLCHWVATQKSSQIPISWILSLGSNYQVSQSPVSWPHKHHSAEYYHWGPIIRLHRAHWADLTKTTQLNIITGV